MKKTLVGLTFCTISLLGSIALMACAISMSATVTQWSGSKIFYILFDCLGLAPIFIILAVLFVFGLIMSIISVVEK